MTFVNSRIALHSSLRKQPSFFAPGPSGVSRLATRAGSEEGPGCFRRLSTLTKKEKLSKIILLTISVKTKNQNVPESKLL